MKLGFFSLLAVLFIGLKLGGIIAWSWLWVLSPLWGPMVLAWAILILLALGGQKSLVKESFTEAKAARDKARGK